MDWRNRRRSDNVSKSSGTGGGPSMRGIGGLGGTGIILLLVFSLLTGQNPLGMLGGILGSGGLSTGTRSENIEEYTPRNEEEAEIEDFLSVMLADTEDVWNKIFADHNAKYREPKLRIYQDSVNSGCGFAQSNMGPFYCGADETVYIDVSFAKQLRTVFDAEGEFPFAYVLAHEVGHHVQKLTGALEKVQSLRGRVPSVEFNREMVKLELQADYYAGVFAHHVKQKGYIDESHVEEGLRAAAGVGDDRIQEMQGGRANPDTFQHGTSEQRSEWFLRGVTYGDIEHGNTFEILE